MWWMEVDADWVELCQGIPGELISTVRGSWAFLYGAVHADCLLATARVHLARGSTGRSRAVSSLEGAGLLFVKNEQNNDNLR